ncbi:MAG: RNA polymerase sigma factor [Acholeplasmatales bacterium]|nr:MAG: RNA polymerase sigma factor [Acholeplasmatales bacterium]
MNHQKLNHHVEQLKQGDLSVFDAVYDMTRVGVYYTILTIVKDIGLTEDLMQETYLKMLDSLPRYRKRHQFQAWLNTIAKNLAINTYNKRKREQPVDQDADPSVFGVTHDQQEKAYALQELLAVLNEEEKIVVIRFVVLEEKHKDIAKHLGKPVGTVTWMYQNALKKMRRKAGEEDDES